MDDMLTQTKKIHKKADSVLENSTLGGRIVHSVLETHPQDILTGCRETYLSDTGVSQTKGSSCLAQDAGAAAYTLRSTSSALEQTAIETLASKCSGAKKTSPCTIEYISSDHDSDIIEVPVSNSRCKTPPNCRFRTRSVIVNERSHERQRNSSIKQEVKMDCSPKNVNNFYALDEPVFEAHDDRTGSESKSLLSWMESVCIPISPEDSDQDMDAAFPKNLPSTSDAENTSVFKSPQSGASSSTSSRLRKTLASKSRKRAKPRPKPRAKPKKPTKRVRAPPAGKSATSTAKRRRRKPRPSGPSSMFSPQEPEIKLKYANHKEEKKDTRLDSFAPYIHMEFSSCTIINFREEDLYSTKKGSQQVVSGSSQRRPVYSWAVLALTPGCRSGISAVCAEELAMLKASGTCMGRTTPVELRPSVNLTAVLLPKSRNLTAAIWTRSTVWRMVHPSLSNGRGRRNYSESVKESGVCSEHWIHEDCSIWTAGIFLVKGKLYGLEEAIRLAQETVSLSLPRQEWN